MARGGSPEGHSERAQQAFDHAVERERAALQTHETAAERHESVATHYRNAAREETDASRIERLNQLSATERDRAEHARNRAASVRERLIGEGIDPENPPD
jgi:hypothetical protein